MITRILLLLLLAFPSLSLAQIVKKIGYATSADVLLHPELSVGDYLSKNGAHTGRYYIIQNEIACAITDSGGDALFTDTSHGLTTGDPIRIKKSAHYNGYGLANVITANTFKITKLDGTTLAYVANESNSFWMPMFDSHDAKNFSLGVNSQGKACWDKYQISANLADFATSYAYENHNSDGTLRYEHGNVDHYTGPIGNRFWFIWEDLTAPITDDGSGNALGTLTAHGLSSGYVALKTGISQYATFLTVNYWYLEVINANTFKFKTNATGSYMPYNGVGNVKFSMTIDASKMEGLDIAGSSSNPVIASNTDGQAIFRRSYESATSYGFELWGGVDHFRMTGEYNTYLGTGNVNYQGRNVITGFYDGLFGIEFQFASSAFNNTIFQVGDGAIHIELDNYRVNGGGHGFAGTMLKTDGYSNLPAMYIKLHDAVITDTHGEGCYIGNTGSNTPGAPQLQHAIHLTMYNMIFARTGVEIIQTGQLLPGSHIYNNVAFLGSMTRHAPFFVAQSTLFQAPCRAGGVVIENNIFIGGGVQSVTIQTSVADEVGDGSPILLRNNVWQDNCGRFIYYNNTANTGESPIRFENNWIKRVSPYDTDRNESQPTFDGLVLQLDIETEFTLNGFHIDNGMSSLDLIEDGPIATQFFPSVVTESVPDVEFQNIGFTGINLRDVYSWFRNYKANHPTHGEIQSGIPDQGEQIDRGIGEILLYDGKTYKSLTVHTSDIAPDLDATNYVQLFWDATGKRSDEVGYTSAYSFTSPLDYRLEEDNYFNEQGMGLFENLPNTRTRITYEWVYDNSGSPNTTFIQEIGQLKDKMSIDLSEVTELVGENNWIRKKVQVVRSNGTVEDAVTNNWYQLN